MELDLKQSVDTALSLNFLAQEAFDMPLECERHEHQVDYEAHYGETNWYVQLKCIKCGDTPGIIAVCDGFRDWVMNKDHYCDCDCGANLMSAWDCVVVCKRIDGQR